MAAVFFAGLVACVSTLGRPTHLTSADVHAVGMRYEHADLGRRTSEASDLVEALARSEDKTTQADLMGRLVVFFTAQFGEHARWEERELYPDVDRFVGGSKPFTASLRAEHALMTRWTDDLRALAAAEMPDARAFVRIARDLLGLARGHAATEDAILLPLLDSIPYDTRAR